MKVHALALTIMVVAVVSDQMSKRWAVGALADDQTIAILPTVELDLSYNSGFSFSTGTGYGQVIGVVVVAISAYLAQLTFRQTSVRRASLLAVILGGALGNLSDRLFRAGEGFMSGEVVDFIDVSWFAVFNIADTCAVGGTALFFIAEITSNRRDRESSDHDGPTVEHPDLRVDNSGQPDQEATNVAATRPERGRRAQSSSLLTNPQPSHLIEYGNRAELTTGRANPDCYVRTDSEWPQ